MPWHEVPAPGFTLTHGRKPKTGEARLKVQFANGYIDDRNEYTAGQLRWTIEGHGWDVAAVKRV